MAQASTKESILLCRYIELKKTMGPRMDERRLAMVNNIVGIGPQREIDPARPARDRARDVHDSAAAATDGVEISPEAQQAAEAARILKTSEQQSEIRQKAVEEAKKEIIAGSYKVQEALLGVAIKVMPYLE